MDFSYLSFNFSNTTPIEWRNPEKNLSRKYSTEDFADLIVSYQQTTPSENKTHEPEIEHWLKRKWQVCLDYYLSSTSHGYSTPAPLSRSSIKVDIALSREKAKEEFSPIQALIKRKTYRKFQDCPLSLETFSQLLLELKEELFPDIWEYYLVIFNIKNIPPGVYRYYSHEHGLTLVKQGIFREKAVQLLCGMSASLTASFLIVLSIDIGKALQLYSYNRALREIYIDSGRMIQKMLIKGMQHNIGGLPSPAMRDTPMCSFLKINPIECIPIYSLTMGIISTKGIL